MVKTHYNFMIKHTFLWSKLIFSCSDLANFLCQSPVNPNDKISYSKPIPFRWQFHAQNLFHSNGKMLNPVPFQQLLEASHAFLLTCGVFDSSSPRWEQLQRQYFTDGLGLPGKLAEYSSKSNSPPVSRDTFVVRDQRDCGKRIELHFSCHYQMSSETSFILPITARCPV